MYRTAYACDCGRMANHADCGRVWAYDIHPIHPYINHPIHPYINILAPRRPFFALRPRSQA